jgi:hypothetical protein
MSKETANIINDSTESENDIKTTNQVSIESEPDAGNEPNEERKLLFTEENYQLIRKIQQEIFEITDVSPSIRKILNEIIRKDQLEEIKIRLIDQFK